MTSSHIYLVVAGEDFLVSMQTSVFKKHQLGLELPLIRENFSFVNRKVSHWQNHTNIAFTYSM